MSFEIEGKLHKKYDTEQKSGTFQTREFVLLTEQGQYANYVKFQLVQDRVEILDQFEEGAMIKVYFDLRGREWQGKYFTNLQAWRIESIGQEQKPKGESAEFPSTSSAYSDGGSSFDDLPF
jgi:hypothetical protein